MKPVYFSIDIETDGLCPGLNSMISLGAVAFYPETGEELGSFKQNFLPLTTARPDPDTMLWWQQHPEAFFRATIGSIPAFNAISSFEKWVNDVAGERKRVACYWKPEFDGSFIRYYSFLFLGGSLFGRSGSGLDIKTVAALALGKEYSEMKIEEVPREWTGGEREHSHDSLEDAREQKNVLMRALKELKMRERGGGTK